jgi:hypothetical protein
MDDDPDFNTGYDAMIADTYESDYSIWFDYIQGRPIIHDDRDYYSIDYYFNKYSEELMTFWDYPIDWINEEEESPPEDDPDFNTGYDTMCAYEEQRPDNPEFPLYFDDINYIYYDGYDDCDNICYYECLEEMRPYWEPIDFDENLDDE